MIEIVSQGIMTTIQDLGRTGQYRRGIPPSGPMDVQSHRLANALVGNRSDAAALEFTYMGPTVTFRSSTVFAVTGGEIPIKLNDETVEPWTSIYARENDVLSFGFMQSGVRGYLAFAGGIDVPLYLGSASTQVNAGLGGFHGRKLTAGDLLQINEDQASTFVQKTVPVNHRPTFPRDVELRYVPGLFNYRITESGQRDFNSRVWTVTPNADRTGIRFSSSTTTPLEFAPRSARFGAGDDPSNVVDSGYPLGAIQLPSGIEPIVLSREAVTAGGYCTVGAVISTDLDRLGQAMIGGAAKFTSVSLDKASAARHEYQLRISRAIESISE